MLKRGAGNGAEMPGGSDVGHCREVFMCEKVEVFGKSNMKAHEVCRFGGYSTGSFLKAPCVKNSQDLRKEADIL